MRKDLQFMTTSSRIKWFEISSFGGGTLYLLYFTVILLYENNRCTPPHIVRLMGNLMSFSKIYDLRGTNVRKDLQFMTTSSRIKWFEISSFGGGT